MKKMIYFGNAASAYSADALLSAVCVDTGITFFFQMSSDVEVHANTFAKAIITCAAGNNKAILEQLMQEINHGQSYVVDVSTIPLVLTITSSVYDVVSGS